MMRASRKPASGTAVPAERGVNCGGSQGCTRVPLAVDLKRFTVDLA
jgi:hypothetical protein